MLKSLLRLRNVCALSIGIVAGLLLWLPQPWPAFTVTLPGPKLDETGAAFRLQAVSSDARFLITHGKHGHQKFKMIHVWDRQRGLEKPVIEVPLDREYQSFTTLFSPDEKTLAVAVWYWPAKRHDLVWFDLDTGRLIKGSELEMDHVLFAADGKLRYVNAGVMRDLQSGEGLRKLEPTIDGFNLVGSFGEFAVYCKEKEVRLRSWLTGEQRSESSDGHYDVSYAPTWRHPWIAKWWPVNESDNSFHITRWKTGEHLAEFRNINHLCFSPRGNHLAVIRADLTIDVYDFPLRKPWGWIVGGAFLAGACAWGIGWTWSRWRNRAI